MAHRAVRHCRPESDVVADDGGRDHGPGGRGAGANAAELVPVRSDPDAEPLLVRVELLDAVGVTGGLRGPREVAVVRDEPQWVAVHRPADAVRDPLVPP